jgi:hypothetical protein|tara:strand:+ start:14811 stop:14939 length:129 start_codon:yes stop_codon:yes gene_type:complete
MEIILFAFIRFFRLEHTRLGMSEPLEVKQRQKDNRRAYTVGL